MSARHYLAYHTPVRMGYGGSAIDTAVLLTSKEAEASAAAREGATVWLIGREEGDAHVYWYGWIVAQEWKAPLLDERGFNGELHGDPVVSRIRPMQDGEPVVLDGLAWLPAALNVLGNGAFGLQALYDETVIAALEALRHTAPRMGGGPPRSRKKRP